MIRKLTLAAALFVAACANVPVEAQLATACNSMATAYLTAAGYRAQHKLSDDAIKTLTDLEAPALAACNKSAPPTDLNSALTSVNAWLQKWALIEAGVKA